MKIQQANADITAVSSSRDQQSLAHQDAIDQSETSALQHTVVPSVTSSVNGARDDSHDTVPPARDESPPPAYESADSFYSKTPAAATATAQHHRPVVAELKSKLAQNLQR